MEQSRYGKYKQRKRKQHPRSKKLQGAFEDKNEWVRCWNCGTTNKIDRIGGDFERSGNVYENVDESDYPALSGSFTGATAVIELRNEAGVLVEYAADGETQATYSTRQIDTAFGCMLCGTSLF